MQALFGSRLSALEGSTLLNFCCLTTQATPRMIGDKSALAGSCSCHRLPVVPIFGHRAAHSPAAQPCQAASRWQCTRRNIQLVTILDNPLSWHVSSLCRPLCPSHYPCCGLILNKHYWLVDGWYSFHFFFVKVPWSASGVLGWCASFVRLHFLPAPGKLAATRAGGG